MAKNNFLTDNLSTVGGVAAVAYGSSTYFQTVSDQIRQTSLTKELDRQLPSNALLDYVGTERFLYDVFYAAIEEEYDSEVILTDFIDLYTGGTEEFTEKYLDLVIFNINKISDYSGNYSSLLRESLIETLEFYSNDTDLVVEIETILDKIHQGFLDSEYIGKDIAKVISLLLNNPTVKISKAPPDSLVSLYPSPRQEKDYKGVKRDTAYLTKQQYYNNTAYISKGGSIRQSVIEGYVGYPVFSLIGESLYNPDGVEGVDLNSISSSVLNVLTPDVNLDPEEKRIYSINLASLVTGN